jgi:hypothetical protein
MNHLYRIFVFINYYIAVTSPFVALPVPIKRHTQRGYSIDDLIDDLEKIAGNIVVGAESVLDELTGVDKQKQLEGKLVPIPIPVEKDLPQKH